MCRNNKNECERSQNGEENCKVEFYRSESPTENVVCGGCLVRRLSCSIILWYKINRNGTIKKMALQRERS